MEFVVFVHGSHLVSFGIQYFADFATAFHGDYIFPLVIVIAAILLCFSEGLTLCVVHFSVFVKAQFFAFIAIHYIFLADVSKLRSVFVKDLSLSVNASKLVIVCFVITLLLGKRDTCGEQYSGQEYYARDEMFSHLFVV